MSRIAKQSLFELSPEVVGEADEQVTRALRKGVPDEYKELLARAETDTKVMWQAEMIKQGGVLSRAAKIYVPKLYNILTKNDLYPPKSASNIIVEDCRKIWSKQHVLKWMPEPEKTKDPIKSRAGKKSKEVSMKKSDQALEEFVEDVKDIVPGLPEADKPTKKLFRKLGKAKLVGLNSPKVTQATKTRVATSGGEGKLDKYGTEVFSGMGDKSAEVRYGIYKVRISFDEHKEIAKAFEESLMAGGGGRYILYIKDGDYESVKPDLNGEQYKTTNK